jgi:hypothetical protein
MSLKAAWCGSRFAIGSREWISVALDSEIASTLSDDGGSHLRCLQIP